MRNIACLMFVLALAFNSVHTKRRQQNNNNNINERQYYRPIASSNINHKSGVGSSFSFSNEKDAQTIRDEKEIKADGSYQYDFETSNGIKRSESGAIDGSIQGVSSYISPEGIEIKTSYVADETGYHPVGDHIPQIPDYILRALEYIRNHPYIEKDYYTGKVTQASISNKQPVIAAISNKRPVIATTKRSAYTNTKQYTNSKRKISYQKSKYNFRH